jgi:acid stress-induced BolA-like protein IbaG/YrbA
MTGTDQIRFCRHCSQSVQDLTEMDRTEAVKLVLRSKGRICLRLRFDPAGAPIFRQPVQNLYSIARRTSRLAAGAFTAVMGLSAAAYAQSPAAGVNDVAGPAAERTVMPGLSSPNAWLAGTVVDPNGAVIPGVQLTLINERTNEVQGGQTDDNGEYRFAANNRDTYSIMAEARSAGFSYKVLNHVCVGASETTRVDIALDLDPSVVQVVVGGGGVDYQQPLVMAAFENDLPKVRELIRNGEDVNEREEDGTTALDLAVSHGNLKMIRRLLRNGANVNSVHTNGETALFWLTEENAVPTLKLLLRSGLNVNHTNVDGDTPLIRFATYGTYMVVNALLEQGADVNAQNKAGRTALMEAAANGSAEAVNNLLAAGAIYGLLDANGDDALQLAKDHDQYEIADILREAGAADQVRPELPRKPVDPSERPIEP